MVKDGTRIHSFHCLLKFCSTRFISADKITTNIFVKSYTNLKILSVFRINHGSYAKFNAGCFEQFITTSFNSSASSKNIIY